MDFSLEAILGYLAALVTAGIAIYREWRSKRGRHVVCTQEKPTFSHLSLSERAREWVEVKYVGSDEHSEPTEIETLSQIVIDIRNDSDTDALNDVELEFRLPEANVLNVWWEEVPPYLSEESDLAYFPEKDFPDDVDPAAEAPWKVQVRLPQLKSFKKYKEVVKVGILANGELDSIEMLPQGSKEGVPSDQVWTAKFVPYEAVLETRGKRAQLKLELSSWLISFMALLLSGVYVLWRIERLDEVVAWLAPYAPLITILLVVLIGISAVSSYYGFSSGMRARLRDLFKKLID